MDSLSYKIEDINFLNENEESPAIFKLNVNCEIFLNLLRRETLWKINLT
jgi:hypothetical protein